MEQNFTPLPPRLNEKGASINLKYVIGSFVIFFLVGVSILLGMFFILKKNVSEPSPNINSTIITPTVGSPQTEITLISPTVSPTPKTVISEKEIKDSGLPETINIGSVEADLSDLQKDLNSL